MTIKDGVRVETADGIYGLTPCGTFTVYPAGYATGSLNEDVRTWILSVTGETPPSTLNGPLIVNDSDKATFLYDQN
ncbi:hypothetical protein [Bifidobacterium thermophilum]|uniref:hypothetical protein n=1 Tax=Bifidobacterium thermophilum TaxID=33905 RepID=UPI0030A3163A